MRFFTTLLLLATTSGSLVSAADVCPGTYCSIGGRCEYNVNGPHCCDGGDSRKVLQCNNGKWELRNTCKENEFCTCTGSKDLVCRKRNKREDVFNA
ncbi:hypothetical protein PG993_013744 [Apiospora rasikravindrae]|uniref:AvrStb6 n=1 Tax=Apiospora rasikravindrae TaxID=990691 RepID=A0ABR1RT48_9PEZI